MRWVRRAVPATTMALLAGLAASGQAWKVVPHDISEVEERYIPALVERARLIALRGRLIRDARAALAGVAACPASPSDMDLVPEAPEGGPLRVYSFLPESRIPCAVVEGQSQGGDWKWSVKDPTQGGTLPASVAARLAMVRAARSAVDPYLGSGIHCYTALEVEGTDYAWVYAWNEVPRNVKSGSGQDRLLTGAMVTVGVVPLLEDYAVQDILIVDQETPCWDVSGVKEKAPLGIRSAQDLGEMLPADCDLLRCRENPELCPRLLKTARGSYLAGADGSLKRLSAKEEAKVKDLAPGLFPKVFSKNRALDGLRSHRKYLKPPEGQPPEDRPEDQKIPDFPFNRLS